MFVYLDSVKTSNSSAAGDDFARAVAEHVLESSSVSSSWNIEDVRLIGVGITDTGAQALAEVIPNTTTLRELHLDYNNITAIGTESLVKAASMCGSVVPTIKVLSLEGNPIGPQGVKTILKHCSTSSLVTLDLVNTGLGNEGMPYVGELLRNTKTRLRCLSLRNNGISDTSSITDALEANSTLERISLSFNQLNDSNVRDFSRAILRNHHLKELYLGWNSAITDVGGRWLEIALSHNDTLHVVDVHGLGAMSLGLQRRIATLAHDIPGRRREMAQRLSLLLLDWKFTCEQSME